MTDPEDLELLAAIDRCDLARVDELLALGAYPDAPPERTMAVIGRDGWRMVDDLRIVPLVHAAEAGDDHIIRKLLALGADPRVVDGRRRHAMFHVTTAAAARALAAAGLPVDEPARSDETALREAIRDNNLVRAAALLGAGANPNATHDRGYTLFMEACGSMARDVAMLRLLVAHGADPHAVSALGWNAFHAAIDVNGAEANTRDSVTSIFTYLHELGVDPDQRNARDMTALDRATCFGTEIEIDVLRSLTTRGLNRCR